jgi:hypothetical protein
MGSLCRAQHFEGVQSTGDLAAQWGSIVVAHQSNDQTFQGNVLEWKTGALSRAGVEFHAKHESCSMKTVRPEEMATKISRSQAAECE